MEKESALKFAEVKLQARINSGAFTKSETQDMLIQLTVLKAVLSGDLLRLLAE